MSDIARWILMRIRTTDCCLIRKGSGIVMTQEQSNQNECQILIYSVQDFLARHSLSPESEKDLQMQEELSFLKLPGFLKLKDPRILSLKMFPVCYRMTKPDIFHNFRSRTPVLHLLQIHVAAISKIISFFHFFTSI